MSRNDPPPAACDIAVVGGGILGLAVARELKLRQPDASICLLEAEGRLAAHQSSHNSGVVHAGVYYQPGSLRAKLCVEGAARLREYCAERGLPWRTTGKLIVATEEGELTRLDELERRARANGVNELTKVDAAEIAQVEPAARGLSALHSPTTAVTDFAAIAESFAQDFETAGGTIHLGTPAAKRLPVDCETAVFCAGLQSDRLARARGGSAEPRIVPIRGGYLEVRADQSDLVRGNVYPVPDPDLPFLGAHLTRTFDGALLIGPTAMITGARDAYRLSTVRRHDLGETLRWPGTWALMRRHWRATLDEAANSVRANRLTRQAARLVPALHGAEVIPGPAGVRAQALDRRGNLVEDFLIERIGDDIHVRNAPSPAATSSLSLAGLIAHEALR